MMNGWLIVNGFLHNAKFDELSDLFLQAAKQDRINLECIYNTDLLVDTSLLIRKKPDFVVFWDKDVLLAQYLEQQGISVMNSSKCIAICDDKRKTHLSLMKHNIPMPDTILAPMTFSGIGFTDMKFLNQIECQLGYPMIVKEAYGSFGAQVYLVQDRDELQSTIENCSSVELLFQRYIASSRGRDIRLQVVGKQVIGSMYRHSDTDFRANISAGGTMEVYHPTCQEKELALQAASSVGADFAGVDLLFGDHGPIVCEVNSNAHFKNLLTCSGVNTAEHILSYIQKKDDYK